MVALAVGVSGGIVLSSEVVGLLLLVGFDELVLLVRELADVLCLFSGQHKVKIVALCSWIHALSFGSVFSTRKCSSIVL